MQHKEPVSAKQDGSVSGSNCMSARVLYVSACIVCQRVYCMSARVLYVSACIVCQRVYHGSVPGSKCM